MFCRLQQAIRRLESNFISLIFGRPFPPECFSVVGVNNPQLPTRSGDFGSSLKDIVGDGIFWAVPKTRRTKEKRLNRKFGWPEYYWKPLVPRTNILMCNTCGHSYEAGHLCPNCYERVKAETEEMQKVIENELKLDPVDKEVVVLYEGEAKEEEKFWEGKRIVEMKKPRPSWFSKNLLQKSTAETSTATDVKPTELA